jgi:hypothetical protein
MFSIAACSAYLKDAFDEAADLILSQGEERH